MSDGRRPHRASPIFFLRIMKTAGTSITAAIAKHFRPQDVLFGDPAAADFAARWRQSSADWGDRVFVVGHWGHGSWQAVPNDAVVFTVLRQPRDHAISNYLHCRRDECGAAIGEMTRRLGFRRFLTEYRYNLMFQTGSLLVPQIRQGEPFPAHDDMAGAAVDVLARLDFVGCVERADDLTWCLPVVLGLPAPLKLPRLNRAKDRRRPTPPLAELRRIYDELRGEPETAPLIATEHRVYEKALALVRQRESMLAQLRRPAFPFRDLPIWRRVADRIAGQS